MMQMEQISLTPYVTGLVFVNCITATWLVAAVGALHIASKRKLFGETLTHYDAPPTRLSGSTEAFGGPIDIPPLSKEETHEFSTAA